MMIKKTLIAMSFAMVLVSCEDGQKTDSAQRETAIAKIDSLEKVRAMYFEKNNILPQPMVLSSIEAMKEFATAFPDDEKTPHYLFEVAKRYEIDLADYKNAIDNYKIVYEKYPDYQFNEMALFHIGNVYHTINDTTEAIKTFQMFIEKFPQHDFADDAEAMIKISRLGIDEYLRLQQEGAVK